MSVQDERWSHGQHVANGPMGSATAISSDRAGIIGWMHRHEDARAIAQLPEILRAAKAALQLVSSVSAFMSAEQRTVVEDLKVAVDRAT